MKRTVLVFLFVVLLCSLCFSASANIITKFGGYINVDGEGAETDFIDDVYLASVANGWDNVWKVSNNAYLFNYPIRLWNGDFYETSKGICYNGSGSGAMAQMFNIDSDNVTSLRFGERVYENFTRSGCTLTYCYPNSVCYLVYGARNTVEVYDSSMVIEASAASSYLIYRRGGNYGDNIVINSRIAYNQQLNDAFFLFGNNTLYNVDFSNVLVYSGNVLDASNVNIYNVVYGYRLLGNLRGVLKDAKIFNVTYAFWGFTSGAGMPSDFIDVDCNYSTVHVQGSSSEIWLNRNNTLQLRFDNGSVPLSGVSVSIYNNTNTLVYSDTSDADGYVDVANLNVARHYQKGADNNFIDWHTNFTLVAECPGFLTLTKSFNLSEKTSWEISLCNLSEIDTDEFFLSGTLEFSPWIMLFSLFISFLYLGYNDKEKRASGGFFLLFAGFALIGLGLLTTSLLYVNTLTTPFGILIIMLGINRAFFVVEETPEGERRRIPRYHRRRKKR